MSSAIELRFACVPCWSVTNWLAVFDFSILSLHNERLAQRRRVASRIALVLWLSCKPLSDGKMTRVVIIVCGHGLSSVRLNTVAGWPRVLSGDVRRGPPFRRGLNPIEGRCVEA